MVTSIHAVTNTHTCWDLFLGPSVDLRGSFSELSHVAVSCNYHDISQWRMMLADQWWLYQSKPVLILLIYSLFIPPNTSTLTVSTTTQHISLSVGLDIHGHNNGGLIFADPLTLHRAPHEVEILDFVWNLMNYHEILLWGLIVISLLILYFVTPPWGQNWIFPTLFDDPDSVELSVCSYMGNFSMLTC